MSMSGPVFDVVIVGTGHAGAQAAITLRQKGFTGSVALLGGEPALPYERPPLSKDYLSGSRPLQRLLVRPPQFWQQRAIQLTLGVRVKSVDPSSHSVEVDDGRRISYRKLIWAAGGRPRPLSCPGADSPNVFALRNKGDVDAIRALLPGAARVVVIGGGYVGLEAAATLSELGKEVTVLEAADRVLARVAGEHIARFYEAEHKSHGVGVRTKVQVDRIETGADGKASAVVLETGERYRCDLVIVGIGIVPETEVLTAAGASGENGVLIDVYGRTSLDDIYAAGDCAVHANRFAGGLPVRIESVPHANAQAQAVVADILSAPGRPDDVPWFWSDQYDLKLQTVGLSAGHDDYVVRGDPSGRSFSVVYLKRGCVVALDCVNATPDYVGGKRHVLSAAKLDPRQIANIGRPLSELSPV